MNLLEGKVRSKVEQKYDNKNSKFEVRTATAVAGVRGTEFVTSYSPVTKVTEVITFKGQVSFQAISVTGTAPTTEPILIEKGLKIPALQKIPRHQELLIALTARLRHHRPLRWIT